MALTFNQYVRELRQLYEEGYYKKVSVPVAKNIGLHKLCLRLTKTIAAEMGARNIAIIVPSEGQVRQLKSMIKPEHQNEWTFVARGLSNPEEYSSGGNLITSSNFFNHNHVSTWYDFSLVLLIGDIPFLGRNGDWPTPQQVRLYKDRNYEDRYYEHHDSFTIEIHDSDSDSGAESESESESDSEYEYEEIKDWSDEQYDELASALKQELEACGKKVVVAKTLNHRQVESQCKVLHGILQDSNNVVVATRWEPCSLLCDFYSKGCAATYDPALVKAFVLWGTGYYKPIMSFECIGYIKAWLEKAPLKVRPCTVCQENLDVDTRKYRWCSRCSEITCLKCYHEIFRRDQHAPCPYCRQPLNIVTCTCRHST